jgi:hypothetical protein
VNKQNGTAVVVVPIASAGDVQVHFVNSTIVTQLKVCKDLPAGSEALQGQPFNFKVTDDGFPPGTTIPVSVTVPAGSHSQCSIVGGSQTPTPFPVGSKATVTETNNAPFIDCGAGLATNCKQTITIGPGVNEIHFTNTAFGQLEVCKYMDNYDPDFGQTFTFNYKNTADASIKGTVTTTAGTCSFPQPVPAGNYTVTEDLSKLFVTMNDGTKLPVFLPVASDARGPFGDPRCVPAQSFPQPSNPSWNEPTPPGCGVPTLTVKVPFFDPGDPSSGETQVSFWNRVIRAHVKVCKLVASDSTATLRNTTWTYMINTTNGFSSPAGPIGNGQCTGDIGNFPVAVAGPQPGCTASMCPNVVMVTENGIPNTVWYVSGITVSGGYDVSFAPPNQTSGVVFYHTGAGTNVVTYTNRACPLGGPCPPA